MRKRSSDKTSHVLYKSSGRLYNAQGHPLPTITASPKPICGHAHWPRTTLGVNQNSSLHVTTDPTASRPHKSFRLLQGPYRPWLPFRLHSTICSGNSVFSYFICYWLYSQFLRDIVVHHTFCLAVFTRSSASPALTVQRSLP